MSDNLKTGQLPLTKGLFLAWLFFSLSIVNANAQDSLEKKRNPFFYNLDSIRDAKIEFGNVLFTPFLGPSYSPEMQLLFTAGGLLTFSYQKNNPLLSRSSIPLSAGISTNGSVQVSCKPVLYGKNDFYRTYAEFWYKKMPDHYWGVGYDNGINVPKSDTTTLYQRNWLRLYSKVVRQVYPNLFGGIVFDINQTKASNINENMLNDPDYQAMGPISRNSGLGIVFQYDSRDLAVNAYKGLFFDITYLHYDRYLGGENRFDVLELDYRQYKELGHRHILAWNYKLRYAIGDVPYTEMSQLGSPFDLRGYFWGRFRDKQSTIALIEYRHMFNRKKPNKKGSLESPFGFATWVGSGAITPELINDKINWLPNAGIGLRYEVQPRMNLRIDFGIGKDSNSLYVSFTEAF